MQIPLIVLLIKWNRFLWYWVLEFVAYWIALWNSGLLVVWNGLMKWFGNGIVITKWAILFLINSFTFFHLAISSYVTSLLLVVLVVDMGPLEFGQTALELVIFEHLWNNCWSGSCWSGYWSVCIVVMEVGALR